MGSTEPFWNGIAERYAAKSIEDLDAYHAKLRATKARLKPTDTVLDIGCGTGSLALELAPCVAHVHAVDISSEMLRIAGAKASDAGIDNVTFHHAPISQLPPFEAQSFDMICAFNILHLVEDLPATLAELHALLKPAGHFVSTTPCLGDSRLPMRPVIAIMRAFGKAPPLKILRADALQRELDAAAFVGLERQAVSSDPRVVFLLARKAG